MHKQFTFRQTKKGLIFYYQDNKPVYILRLLALVFITILLILSLIPKSKSTPIQYEIHNQSDEYQDVAVATTTTKKVTTTTTTKAVVNTTVKTTQPTTQVQTNNLNYRMTFYYPGDDTNSIDKTSSGKSTKDFKLNENGWYTYQGKLVVATANKALLKWDKYSNSTQRMFKLYDELTLNINGKDYDAIVLDVCGACMRDKKIDLYVKDRAHGLDTNITVTVK